MCFSVTVTRAAIERDPRMAFLLEDASLNTGYYVSGFQFPFLPLLGKDGPMAAAWGLIPGWVRDADKAKDIRGKTLNARSETVHEKPSFRKSWPLMRCAVPVTGFFEPHVESGRKSTWFITPKDEGLLFLGGIYQRTSEDLNGFSSLTFSILTVPARDLLARVHNEKLRMPLMLGAGMEEDWLSGDSPLDEMWYCDQSGLEAWEIDKSLIRAGRDSPDVLKPIKNYEPGTLFG